MCSNAVSTVQTANGQIFVCPICSKIHLEFGNIAADFCRENKLRDFSQYLHALDARLITQMNQTSAYRRKVMIAFPETGMKLVLSVPKLDELKQLISSFLCRNNMAEFRVLSPNELCSLLTPALN